jgi:dipeptidyl-peptidase-4
MLGLISIATVIFTAALGAHGVARAGVLTIERMYSDPRLTGIAPRAVAWSPDGKRLAFIWNDDGVRFYDIWLCDASGKNPRRLTDAAAIGAAEGAVLTRAEIDRRETMRRMGGGIFSFRWSPDRKRILFDLEGDLFVVDAGSGKLRRLFRTAASETDPKFSPDGKRVAFIRENDIWMIDLETGMTVQLTDTGSENLYNGLGDYIDYEEVGREEAYWWSPDGGRIAYVQTNVSPIRELLIPDYLGTFVEVRRQLRPVAGGANGTKRLGVLDVETRATVWIEPGVLQDEYIVQVRWHPEGGELLVLREPRDLKTLRFLAANPDDGTVRTLFTVSDEKWVNVSNITVRWAEEGTRLYYTSEASGFNHIYRMDWVGGTSKIITSGDWEVTALHGVDDKGRVWFTSTEVEPAQRHLFYVDEEGKRFRVAPSAGWYLTTMSPDMKRAAVRYSNIENPYDLYILDSLEGVEVAPSKNESHLPERGDRGGAHVPRLYQQADWPVPDGLRRVTHSPAPDFAEIDIPVPYYFTLESRLDGETIHALLLLPPELKHIDIEEVLAGRRSGDLPRLPAIICVHGGGYAQSVFKGWRWRTLYDAYLLNRGYVILDLDYRGSSGYGRKFRTDIHLDMGGSDLEDEMTGLEFLRTLPFVDPERIGMWGWSYGGYMTALAMLAYPDAFYAGAAVASVTDWRNYDTHYTEERLGMPAEQQAAYEKGSPVSYADSLKHHLLLIHGMGDDNVHFQDTVQLVEALVGTGVDFEVMFYPGGKHGIRADASRIHLFRKITRHFDRYLKDEPDAAAP